MAAEGPGDTFIIGGGQIYKHMLPLADRLELTVVDREADGADTFFPSIDLDLYRIDSLDRRDGYSFISLARK